jgi:hypothetical protein
MEMTQLRFQDLLGGGGSVESVRLTRGKMLLLCLNGLFEKVENGLIKLANHLKICRQSKTTWNFLKMFNIEW